MTSHAIPVERGCGSRQEGGIYFELGFGPGGRPVEDFLLDPPIPVAPEMAIKNIGVQLIERNGIYHIVDRIGQEFYPNVADFVEEVRRFGLSRRLPKTLDFAKLTPESRILLVHDRAWIENCVEYEAWACPKANANHASEVVTHRAAEWAGCCAGVWWRDIQGGEPMSNDHDRIAVTIGETRHIVPCEWKPGAVSRTMPSFSYIAFARPEGLTPVYAAAFLASFPCSRLAVVAGEGAAEAIEKASRTSLPVEEVEQ